MGLPKGNWAWANCLGCLVGCISTYVHVRRQDMSYFSVYRVNAAWQVGLTRDLPYYAPLYDYFGTCKPLLQARYNLNNVSFGLEGCFCKATCGLDSQELVASLVYRTGWIGRILSRFFLWITASSLKFWYLLFYLHLHFRAVRYDLFFFFFPLILWVKLLNWDIYSFYYWYLGLVDFLCCTCFLVHA